jgi:hypothetical protein
MKRKHKMTEPDQTTKPKANNRGRNQNRNGRELADRRQHQSEYFCDFVGRERALEGFVYDLTSDPDQFIRTTKGITNFVGRNYREHTADLTEAVKDKKGAAEQGHGGLASATSSSTSTATPSQCPGRLMDGVQHLLAGEMEDIDNDPASITLVTSSPPNPRAMISHGFGCFLTINQQWMCSSIRIFYAAFVAPRLAL